jgi:3-deoxy-D-manno-octulosonic-acid transferase
VIVPRSPQRFDSFYNHLSTTPAHTLGNAPCLSVVRRSQLFDQQLNPRFPKQPFDTIDALLGDSLGEMFFYLQMAHLVIVGASFVPLGSHNVIEPLALKKPVLVGPSIWGIEYPGIEAMRMGVLKQCMTLDELSLQLSNYTENNNEHTLTAELCDDFYKTHKGSTQRHLAKLNTWLKLPLIG